MTNRGAAVAAAATTTIVEPSRRAMDERMDVRGHFSAKHRNFIAKWAAEISFECAHGVAPDVVVVRGPSVAHRVALRRHEKGLVIALAAAASAPSLSVCLSLPLCASLLFNRLRPD